jgi:hypothetical protein
MDSSNREKQERYCRESGEEIQRRRKRAFGDWGVTKEWREQKGRSPHLCAERERGWRSSTILAGISGGIGEIGEGDEGGMEN